MPRHSRKGWAGVCDLASIGASRGAPPAIGKLALSHAWQKAVGPALGGVTRPGRLDRGRLNVEVRDAAWLPALASLEGEILGRLSEILPSLPIRSLAFRHWRFDPPSVRWAGPPPRRAGLHAPQLGPAGEGHGAPPFQGGGGGCDDPLQRSIEAVAVRYLRLRR